MACTLFLSCALLFITVSNATPHVGTLTAFSILDADNHCNVSIEIEPVKGVVTVNMTGPHGKWFGVGFGNTSTCPTCMNNTYAIVCQGGDKDKCQENVLDTRGYGKKLKSSIELASHSVEDHIRSVSITRKVLGNGGEYFSFPLKAGSMDIIHAIGQVDKFEEKTAHMGPGGYLKLQLK